MGSVVFTWGLFEVELAARPITILSPCFALDKVKIREIQMKKYIQNFHFFMCLLFISFLFFFFFSFRVVFTLKSPSYKFVVFFFILFFLSLFLPCRRDLYNNNPRERSYFFQGSPFSGGSLSFCLATHLKFWWTFISFFFFFFTFFDRDQEAHTFPVLLFMIFFKEMYPPPLPPK